MKLQIADEQGHVLPDVIIEVLDQSIKLDAIHPLAGKTLVFDIELMKTV